MIQEAKITKIASLARWGNFECFAEHHWKIHRTIFSDFSINMHPRMAQ
jgi:hypothetical protein